MFKLSELREAFERLVEKDVIITPIGRRRVYSWHIRVYSGRSLSVISLEADCGFPVCVARSYPVTPKAAYRCVVGL